MELICDLEFSLQSSPGWFALCKEELNKLKPDVPTEEVIITHLSPEGVRVFVEEKACTFLIPPTVWGHFRASLLENAAIFGVPQGCRLCTSDYGRFRLTLTPDQVEEDLRHKYLEGTPAERLKNYLRGFRESFLEQEDFYLPLTHLGSKHMVDITGALTNNLVINLGTGVVRSFRFVHKF